MSSHNSPASQERDPLFRIVTTAELRRHHLEELAAGLCGAVRVCGILAEPRCLRFLSAFDAAVMDHYDPERYGLPIGKFGPVLNEYISPAGLPADYWRASDAAERYWSDLASTGGGEDPRDIRRYCREYLRAAWGAEIEPAVIQGRPVFWGILREARDGTLIHWDEAARETRQTPMRQLPIAQLACNVFISVPATGGATSVWRHRWQPQDERHRLRFGYTETAVDPYPCLRVTPGLGDAVFFDPRNFHRAEAASGRGRRVSLSFFLGVTATGALSIWS
jgi:hypothetical protein